ncbi:hypothetical protein EXE10_03085 [Acinetobacter sp. WCHAc060033]|uniref:hypothetical protein n=1 Tax=Acinetobacter sp. WCHAc060033 TaxID=2518624 RepID=UPI00102382A2|nr:hypothetical protein [Acinetobacter sp. WCHAc060033]RZG88297.1 hypothetical protein EXE10_03085 [Acinetobacter sp. WCHAc060033]
MGLYAFLDSCELDHMPNGSLNEWDSLKPNAFSLECKSFIPLMWWLLYQQNSIQHARYVDEFDIDDPQSDMAREECIEDYGDATYPYFVISQSQALHNLIRRKQGFLSIFGQNFSAYYDDFYQLIEIYYPNYILFRPNYLDLSEQSEQEFRDKLSIYEALESMQIEAHQNYWDTVQTDLSHWESDLRYFLLGTRYSGEEIEQLQYIQNQYYIEPASKKNELPEWLSWLLAVIIAIPAIFVWFKTHSTFFTVMAFSVSAFLIGILLIRFSSHK